MLPFGAILRKYFLFHHCSKILKSIFTDAFMISLMIWLSWCSFFVIYLNFLIWSIRHTLKPFFFCILATRHQVFSIRVAWNGTWSSIRNDLLIRSWLYSQGKTAFLLKNICKVCFKAFNFIFVECALSKNLRNLRFYKQY